MSNQKSLFQEVENHLRNRRVFIDFALAWIALFFALFYTLFLGASIIEDGFTWLHIIQIPVMLASSYLALKQLIKDETGIFSSFTVYFLVAIGAGKWMSVVWLVLVLFTLFLHFFIDRKKQSAS